MSAPTEKRAAKRIKSPLENIDLSKIVSQPSPNPINDQERKRFENECRAFEREDELKQLRNKNFRHILRQRWLLTKSIPRFVRNYLIFVCLLVLASAISLPEQSYICRTFFCVYFQLSDKVLIALLSTTTVNIIGLYVIVAKYVFSPHLDKE
ncbi:hypothetical protein D3C87_1200000 [compost metagenome]